jgi:UDP-hydrolysing UDP-N-acetyl-D-glucosamine 2-epimerase
MRDICVIIGSRANWGRLKSVCKAITSHLPSSLLRLRLIVGASALLDRFGCVDVIEREFNIDEKVYTVVEGDTPGCMALTTGLFTIQLENALRRLKPDVVLIHGDRYEMLSAATVAAYMNIPLAHTEGGEITGSIDDKVRRAISQLADIHFPVTQVAADRLKASIFAPARIHVVGSTALDAIRDIDYTILPEIPGVGPQIDISRPFLLVSQHPVTTEYGLGEAQIRSTLDAVRVLDVPTVWLWPNVDAGNEDMAGFLRRFREHEDSKIRFVKTLPPEDYARLLFRCACLIGNTSSGIKEGGFLGTPYVAVGSRQSRREVGKNVVRIPHDSARIVTAVESQIDYGRYPKDLRFGDGHAGEKIAEVLSCTPLE